MEKIVGICYANRKTKALEERKLATVVPVVATSLVHPHAFAGGGFQGNTDGNILERAG